MTVQFWIKFRIINAYFLLVDQVNMVECGNTACRNGRWFHMVCVENTSSLKGNWFCSADCSASGSVNICTCRKKKSGKLLKCAAGDSCDRGVFFHEECVAQENSDGESEIKSNVTAFNYEVTL